MQIHANKETITVLTETDIVAQLTVESQRNYKSRWSRSVGVTHLDQLGLPWTCWSPERLGAEAQLGLERTHLTVRAPRRLRLHMGPAIRATKGEKTLFTTRL